RRYQEVRNWRRLGITVEKFAFEFGAFKRHQNQMVKLSALGVRKSLQDLAVDCVDGKASILAPGKVQITLPTGGTEHRNGENILIAWGSEVSPLPAIPFSARVIPSDTLLQMETLPASLNVIGGGAIGIEFATFLTEVGVKVTLLELMDQILPYEDPDIAAFLTGELKKKGIEVHTATTVRNFVETSSGVVLKVSKADQDFEIAGDYVLVSTGRRPRLNQEELDRLGIAYSNRGIAVDDCLHTNVSGIFAVGDVTGGILLAHRAAAQGRTVSRFLFADPTASHSDDTVPAVVYSHPPVARVGLTETKARQLGLNIDVMKKEYGGNIIARSELIGNGFVKMLFHEDYLIGAAIAGDQAPDLITVLCLAVNKRMHKADLQNWIIPHPTLSELLDLHD
ncbi:MAG: NAD(P)/FAD-dependent oxidoreductase, partial [Syntrophaceae bacterium]|nr:NAD(P)/FAD-dependent oxidoreductase [Syntrophaceae bacterium]